MLERLHDLPSYSARGIMRRERERLAERWERLASAYAREGQHREANEAEAEADLLWRAAEDLLPC